MGIELKDITIADLARDRIKRSLLLIGLMDIILLFGAWLISGIFPNRLNSPS